MNTMKVNGDHRPPNFKNNKKYNKGLYDLIFGLIFTQSYCMTTEHLEYIACKPYGSLL